MDPTKVSFGITSVIGYLTTAGAGLAALIKALEGVHLTSSDPLVIAAVVAGAVTTFIRGLQAAAKAHGAG